MEPVWILCLLRKKGETKEKEGKGNMLRKQTCFPLRWTLLQLLQSMQSNTVSYTLTGHLRNGKKKRRQHTKRKETWQGSVTSTLYGTQQQALGWGTLSAEWGNLIMCPGVTHADKQILQSSLQHTTRTHLRFSGGKQCCFCCRFTCSSPQMWLHAAWWCILLQCNL